MQTRGRWSKQIRKFCGRHKWKAPQAYFFWTELSLRGVRGMSLPSLTGLWTKESQIMEKVLWKHEVSTPTCGIDISYKTNSPSWYTQYLYQAIAIAPCYCVTQGSNLNFETIV